MERAALLERFLAEAPNSIEAHQFAARLYGADGDFVRQAAAYERILVLSPRDRAALIGLATLLRWQGQGIAPGVPRSQVLDRVEDLLSRALAQVDDCETRDAIANVYLERAVPDPREPDFLQASLRACQRDFEQGIWRDRLGRLLEQSKAAPEVAGAEYCLAVSHDYGPAASRCLELRRAPTVPSDDWIGELASAMVASDSDPTRAIAHLETVVELRPDFRPAHDRLALLYLAQPAGARDRACLHIGRARELALREATEPMLKATTEGRYAEMRRRGSCP